jgi:hypothetical protein
MDKAAKRYYLALIAAEQTGEAIEQLLEALPAAHPDVARIRQLEKRRRELQERIDLGTLNNEDIARVRARINGGLRDLVRELKPMPTVAESAGDSEEEPAFQLQLHETEKDTAPTTDWRAKGFFGELAYTGSPTKKEQTVDLRKGYGAAYHTAREAIRKAGMSMVRGDRDGGTLEAEIKATGAGGYGEKILFWLTPTDAATTRIHVVVDSQLPTLAFDFGRHKTKLGILVSYLR